MHTNDIGNRRITHRPISRMGIAIMNQQLLQYQWAELPFTAVELTLESMQSTWQRLHIGNNESFPDYDSLIQETQKYPILAASIGNQPLQEIAETLQQAWLDFHLGKYQSATELALSTGLFGLNLASKAMAIYATHLETNESLKLKLFVQATELAEHAIEIMPDNPDSHYNRAYALGRYSQGISITKALAEGYGNKVKDSLTKTIELDPNHAEAHIALGTYHAEIIDQVGRLVASISYGASKDEGLKHFRTAIRIAPDFPIAYTQYADGLLMMFGPGKLKEAQQLYTKASENDVVDAMEQIDQQTAIDELAAIN